MTLQQADISILEGLFSHGGSAILAELQRFLAEKTHTKVSDSMLRNRLGRLALQGYVLKIPNRGYELTLLGQEHFLDELAWHSPESPLLLSAKQRKSNVLPAEVEPLEEGGYLATCRDIQGCHAEGATVAEALENLEDAARVLLELRLEDGKQPLKEAEEYHPGRLLRAELVLPFPA